ncbi:MAG: Lrp/AsnC family transcriptional regulator [Nanoarchaeota archaeon]
MGGKLDKKDLRLLSELDMNGRATLTELAGKVGLSKQSIAYRINSLQDSGVIEGFYAILNIPKLGFMYVRTFIELSEVKPEIERQLVEYASSLRDVGWIIKTEGKWDLVLVTFAQDVLEIKEFVNNLVLNYGTIVKNYAVSIATAIHHLRHKYLTSAKGSRDIRDIIMTGKTERPVLEKLDMKLLKIVAVNARASLKEIGKQLKVSYKVISYRLRKLEKEGIIMAYRSSINTKELGYSHYKVLLTIQSASRKRLDELKGFLKLNPNVIYITEALSIADLEFEAVFAKLDDLYGLITLLRSGFSDIIKDYETLIAAKFYRLTYLPEIQS